MWDSEKICIFHRPDPWGRGKGFIRNLSGEKAKIAYTVWKWSWLWMTTPKQPKTFTAKSMFLGSSFSCPPQETEKWFQEIPFISRGLYFPWCRVVLPVHLMSFSWNSSVASFQINSEFFQPDSIPETINTFSAGSTVFSVHLKCFW